MHCINSHKYVPYLGTSFNPHSHSRVQSLSCWVCPLCSRVWLFLIRNTSLNDIDGRMECCQGGRLLLLCAKALKALNCTEISEWHNVKKKLLFIVLPNESPTQSERETLSDCIRVHFPFSVFEIFMAILPTVIEMLKASSNPSLTRLHTFGLSLFRNHLNYFCYHFWENDQRNN